MPKKGGRICESYVQKEQEKKKKTLSWSKAARSKPVSEKSKEDRLESN